MALAAAVILPAAAVLLYSAAPTEGSLYPRCVFRQATGLHCPGCGSTRCLHALLHGDVRQAAAYNLALLVALPFLSVWAFRTGVAALLGKTVHRRPLPAWLVLFVFFLVIAFWVLRNLDYPPFTLLAPHPV
jgi:hypothetical protein